MPYTIDVKREAARGCGYRAPGGLYIVCDGEGRACGRMPIPLERCPTCGGGIKPARGWTWIDSNPIIEELPPCETGIATMGESCKGCPLLEPMGRVGLIWVGAKYYPSPGEFLQEAEDMGISRRIPAVPKGFVTGETWVWLAHRKTIENPCPGRRNHMESADSETCAACDLPLKKWWTPGIFHVFRPTRIEYVVKKEDEEERLQTIANRGITLVQIERIGENLEPL